MLTVECRPMSVTGAECTLFSIVEEMRESGTECEASVTGTEGRVCAAVDV